MRLGVQGGPCSVETRLLGGNKAFISICCPCWPARRAMFEAAPLPVIGKPQLYGPFVASEEEFFDLRFERRTQSTTSSTMNKAPTAAAGIITYSQLIS